MANKETEIKIRVDVEVKQDIKALAKLLGISMTDLLVWSTLYPERVEAFKKNTNKN